MKEHLMALCIFGILGALLTIIRRYNNSDLEAGKGVITVTMLVSSIIALHWIFTV